LSQPSKYNYANLLERAFKAIPEKAQKASKYEIPKSNVMTIGSKTIVTNFKEICERINREAAHLSRYILRELATAGNIEESRLVLQGKFSKEHIDNLIERYVRTYVICPSCGKPDTKLVKEGRLTFILCEVCGAKNPVRTLM